MSRVHFNLNGVKNLGDCVAVTDGTNATNPMPDRHGIYVIHNGNNSNVYVGIAGSSLKERFSGRYAAISELGLDKDYMAKIEVWYGVVTVTDTGSNQSRQYVSTGMIDGKNADLEHLLMRMYSHGPSPVNTTTNTSKAKTHFYNTTGNPIDITVAWCNSDGYAADSFQMTVGAGGSL